MADSILNKCLLAGPPNVAPGWGGETTASERPDLLPSSNVTHESTMSQNSSVDDLVSRHRLESRNVTNADGMDGVEGREGEGGVQPVSNLDWPAVLSLTMKSTKKPSYCSSLNDTVNAVPCTLDDDDGDGSGDDGSGNVGVVPLSTGSQATS